MTPCIYDCYIFSIQSATCHSSPSTSETKPNSSSISTKSKSGDDHDDLEHTQVKFTKNFEDQPIITQKSSINNKYSSTNSPLSTPSSSFSLKNPVTSFRSWVSKKRSSKEDPLLAEQSEKVNYRKIDTSPTPRKSSMETDSARRNRTNSASATPTNSHNQEIQTSSISSTDSTRVKKKSSFSLCSNNSILFLKRTSETTTNTNETESTEQTGTGSGGPLGCLKTLVRGEKQ